MTDNQLRTKRDNFRVEIRRQYTEKIFSQKRQKSTNTNVCSDELVNVWYKRLVNKDAMVINDILAATHSKEAQFNLQIMFKHEIYNLIIQLWIDCDLEFNLLRTLLQLLGNIHSYTVFDDLAFLQNQAAMNKLIQLLQMTDQKQIQSNIFFLLSNLVGIDNGTKARTLADYNFCSILKSMWCDNLFYMEHPNFEEFTWFLSNFFSYKSSNIAGFSMSEVRDILPIVVECIRLESTKEVKMYSLLTLKSILQAKEEVIELIIKKTTFFQEIQQMERKCGDEEIQQHYVEIICAFALGDDEITSSLIESNILDYLLQLYIQPGRKNQKRFKKAILWSLHNFCFNQQKIKKIIQHDLIKYMQIDADCPDLIKDILQVIRSLSRIQDSDLLKYVLMNRNIADIIIAQLKLQESKNTTLLCMEIINNFATQIGKYSQSDINMAVEVFMSKGFDIILHKLEYDQDQDIVNYALRINETFLQ